MNTLILLSNGISEKKLIYNSLSKRIDERCIFIRVDSVLIPLSKQAMCSDDDDDDGDIYTGIPNNIVINCNNNCSNANTMAIVSKRTTNSYDTNVLILLSKRNRINKHDGTSILHYLLISILHSLSI